jgi:branched-chain amino acid transport system permease protein
VRSNERAAAAAGVSVPSTKFAAYAISSAIAGAGGVLYAYALGGVSIDRFGILIALQFIAFAYVGGITRVSGAVLAGLMTAEGLIPHLLDVELGMAGTWTLLAAGLLLLASLLAFPDGVAAAALRPFARGSAGGVSPSRRARSRT